MQHDIVSAVPENMQASGLISSKLPVSYPDDFPSLQGQPLPPRLLRIAKALKPYDLILTYNWGAMDAVMGHTLFGRAMGLPPLIHHEDGFNEDEREKLKGKRNWFRRVALGQSSALVVPSEQLEEIALDVWHQPMGRVKRISNGIDTLAFAKKPKRDAIPGITKQTGEKWVGTLAGLRAVKNLPRLVRAFAGLPKDWRLVIVGEGPEKDTIRNEAIRLGIGDRVDLPGFAANPARYVGLFDIFALSSDTEQFPISVVEAMAAGIPVASTNVGDVADMVGPANAPFIVSKGDEEQLGIALSRLAADAALRKAVGEANRIKALAEYDEKVMIDAYRRLYSSAMGKVIPK